jgi:RNA polymerase sigma factor for flagellar operon FliA
MEGMTMSTLQQNEPLTKEQIHEKWIGYIDARDIETRDFFINHYMNLVHGAANWMHGKLRGHVDLDDIVSSGVLGLMEAIEGFDPRRGFVFETYCSYRIRGAMLDEIRAMDWVPRIIRREMRELADATNELSNSLCRAPDEDEMAAKMGLPVQKLLKMQQNERATHLISLSTKVFSGNNADSMETEIVERVDSKERRSPSGQREEFNDLLRGKLSKSERLIFTLYYVEGLTFYNVGRTLDLSESRISQIHTLALARLRQELQDPADACPQPHKLTGPRLVKNSKRPIHALPSLMAA